MLFIIQSDWIIVGGKLIYDEYYGIITSIILELR